MSWWILKKLNHLSNDVRRFLTPNLMIFFYPDRIPKILHFLIGNCSDWQIEQHIWYRFLQTGKCQKLQRIYTHIPRTRTWSESQVPNKTVKKSQMGQPSSFIIKGSKTSEFMVGMEGAFDDKVGSQGREFLNLFFKYF